MDRDNTHVTRCCPIYLIKVSSSDVLVLVLEADIADSQVADMTDLLDVAHNYFTVETAPL